MVRLEKINNLDFSKIVEWNKNTSSNFLKQWAGSEYQYPISVEQMEEKYYSEEANKNGSTNFTFKIIDEKDLMIGCIDLLRINYERKHATVGKFLIGEEENRNRGYGKQAMEATLKIAFEHLKMKKVRLHVYDFNKNAINCYESVGFKKVSFFKNVLCRESGDFVGIYLMSICEG